MRQCAIILLLLPAALTVFANDKSNQPWLRGKPPESIVSSDEWLRAYKILDDKEQAVGLVLSTDK
ncbi:hypothetical protein ACN3E9_11250 [Vibrio pectenicida]|uniref:hypothetical protein n=1 Tax=Vibrio pectenicida TaxID=62763 RepID=UPI003B9CE89E